MKERAVSGIVLMLLLTSMLTSIFTIQPVKAETMTSASQEPPPTEWSKTYGGTGEEVAFSVVQTVDGGYAIAGGRAPFFGAVDYDAWLVKTDSAGTMQWSRTYGGTDHEVASSVVQTSDGGYAIAGYTDYHFWLVKTDSTGNQQWAKTYGGTGFDYAYSVVQTVDGGYALAGSTYSSDAGNSDFWLVKTDASGNMQWNKTYAYRGVNDEWVYSVVQTVDGGYALAGYTASFDDPGNEDFWLVKTDSTGTMQWNKTYGGTSYDHAFSVIQTSDGGYAITGCTHSFGAGTYDFWLVKTDPSGNLVWNRTYGGTGEDIAYSVVQTVDGGYALAGYTDSFGVGGDDFWLVKTDSTGIMQWNKTYGGTSYDHAFSVIQTSDGGYAITGWTHSFGAGEGDAWLVKLAASPSPPLKFKVGDRVRTTANLNVRVGPGLSYGIIDTMTEGALGQIMGGPVEADGYTWWDVNYDIGVRGWSAENWLEIFQPSVCGRPVLVTRLEISPEAGFRVGGTLTATFTIQNQGDAAITLDKLLLGGRFNGGTLSNGEFPDFTFQTVTLQPEQSHQYEGTLELTEAGNYQFFIAYYIQNPNEEEKKLLDENNWNTCIDLAEGLTDQDRTEEIGATVDGKSTRFVVGDCVIIQKYNRFYQEPRLDSDSGYIYENECGRIIENENNGIFADGHFWWYVELQPIHFKHWVLEEAIIRNQPPIPSLNYAPQHPKANEEVVFDASGSQDADGKIERYTWYLNGEFIGWNENPIMFYAFEKEGTFNLKVEVTDDCFESKSIEVTIEVEGKTRPEKIRKILDKDDIIKIADELGIPHYTQDCGLWCQIEYFVLEGENYSEDELLAVLNKPIKKISETGSLTFVEDVIYGMRIRNILEDAKLVDLTSSGTWNPEPDDFKNLKKANTWVETIVNWEEPFLSRYLEVVAYTLDMPLSAVCHVVGGLTGPILTIAEGYKVYKTLDFLENLLYKRALWFYLQQRIGGDDSVNAFGSSPVPIKYRSETTREYWEELYQTYKAYIIPGEGGLGENFEEIKAELRRHIYDTMESYSLMPRKFVRIGSVGELRVYDSEGRETGMVNGEIREEISYSMYDEDTETIIIFPAIGSYHYEILGIGEGTYSLKIASVEYGNTIAFTATDISTAANAVHQYIVDWDALSLGEDGVSVQVDSNGDGVFEHTFASDSELTQSEYVIATDNIPPQTWLNIGEPKYVVNGLSYLTSATPFELIAEDNLGGSGVASTAYRIYNDGYDWGWTMCTSPFYLIGLSDGAYNIDYNSTDYAGNVELSNTVTVILDNTGPSVTVENPPAGWALQDGVTFTISAIDASGTSSMSFSIREANGGDGTPVGFEDLPVTYNAITGKWTLFFNTLQLPDGDYIVLVKAEDNLGHASLTSVDYSIRNWAVLELLPATENNKAGRTMPVKFALRVAASVDPSQPFVYNEDLTIKICATKDANNILQTSTFGDTARDYRIITVSELYITNFQTLKTPMQYTVAIYRGTFWVGSFDFRTVK